MDDQRFDNIARRLGGLRSRRSALKIAGSGAAATLFAALGLETSARARGISTENHCLVRGQRCESKGQCCGAVRRSKEIVCSTIAGMSGDRCCGKTTASCVDDDDCCELYFCNNQEECVHS
jgi:hypothetical protein